MKCYYVYTRIEEDIETSGEAKKAKMQAEALSNNGVKTEVLYHDRYVKNNKILIRIPFYNIYSRKFEDKLLDRVGDADALYIRKYVIDKSFIKMLKRIRKEYPQISIIFEVPTYPYDKEWSSFVDLPLLIKDRMYRRKLYKYIDRIVTFSNDHNIFRVSTIMTSNGIDVDAITPKKKYLYSNNNINLLGVATLEKWHGYDRIINGLFEYYKKQQTYKVVFNIVGGGAEYDNLKRMVKDLGLEDYVLLHGSKKGDELNSFFDRADVGVGSMGMYRIGLQDGYTLKLREYMARGLPFIYAYDDALIESCGDDFYLKFPNDNSNIDIESIIGFYERIRLCNNIGDKLRKIAGQNLTWKSQMKPIADYIKEDKKNG